MFLFDQDCQYVRARRSEIEAVGLSAAEIEGQTPHDLFPEALADELVHYYRRALAGEKHTFEQAYQGEQYRIRTAPVRTNDGTVTRGMAVTTNITEQAERLRKLRRQNERLEEFASVVSHDLRSPLNTIDGRVALARRDCDSDHLAAAETAIDRMERIIDDVLRLARQGRDIGATEPVELRTAVDDAWQLVANDQQQGTLLYPDGDGDGALPTIEADPDRLSQLLENLLASALEHGGADVTVSVGPLDDGFYIEDDGDGIAEDEREEVFSAGYSTSRDGTGFGLSILNGSLRHTAGRSG